MFYPGETIAHTFILPYEKSYISKVIVSYRQSERLVLEKVIASSRAMQELDEGTAITVTLAEEESLLFEDNAHYDVQVNVFMSSGRATSSQIRDWTGLQHVRDTSITVINSDPFNPAQDVNTTVEGGTLFIDTN